MSRNGEALKRLGEWNVEKNKKDYPRKDQNLWICKSWVNGNVL